MRKYFFFDIDGTLTNSNPGGIILPSTFETLDKLRKNCDRKSALDGNGF